MKFSASPVLDISITFNLFVPNMIALGGVAAGSINAKDAAIVAGNMNMSGLSSMLIAKPAKTGKKVSTVATLDVNSVKNVINNAMDKTITNG